MATAGYYIPGGLVARILSRLILAVACFIDIGDPTVLRTLLDQIGCSWRIVLTMVRRRLTFLPNALVWR
jgi:hypothetical protein